MDEYLRQEIDRLNARADALEAEADALEAGPTVEELEAKAADAVAAATADASLTGESWVAEEALAKRRNVPQTREAARICRDEAKALAGE